MAKKKRGRDNLLPEEPDVRIKKGLTVAFRIWETASSIHCNIWWGREQTAGKRLYSLSRLYPYPNRITKGSGVFEEILYIFKNLAVELYTVGPERGGNNEYADYAQALKRIEDASISAIIKGGIYEGRDPEYATAVTTLIDFQKN